MLFRSDIYYKQDCYDVNPELVFGKTNNKSDKPKEVAMKLEVGDLVLLHDPSYSEYIVKGELTGRHPGQTRGTISKKWKILATDLNYKTNGIYTCDVLLSEVGTSNTLFTQQRYLLPYEEQFVIGGNKVEFTKDGIQVGCTTVDKATILAIAKKFQ